MKLVVIGGTSGMGRATVEAARELGWDVVSAGRRGDAFVDVTDPESVKALFDQVGTLDHLLVTASPGRPGPILEQEPDEARTFLDGKLFGAWLAARYAAPRMSPNGSITFVTGVAVVKPPRGASTVVAAFAGVEALTRALALELGPIRVNTIRPGYTDSEMWSGLPDPERARLRRRVADALPVGRMGTPEDIAHAAVFLMTSCQTTGAVLEVSGGETLVDAVDSR
jgi:NAD(P)-dependent dehydrogenase (short-subunit alcohol dehydrogenase family)